MKNKIGKIIFSLIVIISFLFVGLTFSGCGNNYAYATDNFYSGTSKVQIAIESTTTVNLHHKVLLDESNNGLADFVAPKNSNVHIIVDDEIVHKTKTDQNGEIHIPNFPIGIGEFKLIVYTPDGNEYHTDKIVVETDYLKNQDETTELLAHKINKTNTENDFNNNQNSNDNGNLNNFDNSNDNNNDNNLDKSNSGNPIKDLFDKSGMGGLTAFVISLSILALILIIIIRKNNKNQKK